MNRLREKLEATLAMTHDDSWMILKKDAFSVCSAADEHMWRLPSACGQASQSFSWESAARQNHALLLDGVLVSCWEAAEQAFGSRHNDGP